ncbi:hypothetical protein VM98_33990, partial [Streptomyces rubellomurinus subsp. indigoferus]
ELEVEGLDLDYRTPHLDEGVNGAELMVNVADLATLDPLPSRAALTAYVRRNVTQPDGSYLIAHTQDRRIVRRAPAG